MSLYHHHLTSSSYPKKSKKVSNFFANLRILYATTSELKPISIKANAKNKIKSCGYSIITIPKKIITIPCPTSCHASAWVECFASLIKCIFSIGDYSMKYGGIRTNDYRVRLAELRLGQAGGPAKS